MKKWQKVLENVPVFTIKVAHPIKNKRATQNARRKIKEKLQTDKGSGSPLNLFWYFYILYKNIKVALTDIPILFLSLSFFNAGEPEKCFENLKKRFSKKKVALTDDD